MPRTQRTDSSIKSSTTASSPPSRIRINTVQGIGDIFWTYQKLAPYFDRIDVNVLTIRRDEIQHRAEAFCRMLPKVGAITFTAGSPKRYAEVAEGRYPLGNVIALAKLGPVDYAVNAPLEQGVNLLEIDPGSRVDEFVDLGLPATVERKDYLCLYVSGTGNPRTTWRAGQWIPIARRLAQRMRTPRIVLVGASWDRLMQAEIAAGLRASGFAVDSHVAMLTLGDSVNIIRGARFFLGYQSGLNIIAENYDVPQMMVYFDKLRPMLYTWAKPRNVRTLFHACTFADDGAALVDALPLDAIENGASRAPSGSAVAG